MAKTEIVKMTCDECGASIKDVRKEHSYANRKQDEWGKLYWSIPSEVTGQSTCSVDLCPSCVAKLLAAIPLAAVAGEKFWKDFKKKLQKGDEAKAAT